MDTIIMDMETKLALLDEIYKLHDDFMGMNDMVCKKGCATCCTRNVTLTTLEATRIATALSSDVFSGCLAKINEKEDLKRMQPSVTTNEFADLIIAGGDVPEDESDPQWGPCPVLESAECPIYEVRPLGCRALVSKQDCGESGFADMDDFVMTVNNVFNQYIEHIDGDGFTGNFTDMMRFVADSDNLKAYREGSLGDPEPPLIKNHPMKILMVPPEYHGKIGPILESLQNIKVHTS